MMTVTISEEVILPLHTDTVYQVLVDAEAHSKLCGSNVNIAAQPNADFIVGGDEPSIYGRILELIPGKKIVLHWRLVSPEWPQNHFSTVSIELEAKDDGTTLFLTHKDIPLALKDAIQSGWNEYYWTPLRGLKS
ncbi:SRPBCC domain-containing protein [Allocoleopsis sp.]|uniref:SRPBCC domain-containing protein n=1 Tax=Allocoleopsis sp. TaxID=3088169 RepID=UPI002FCFD2EE